MAKKSFVISNGDGRVTFSNTGSVSIDDGTGANAISGAISASNLYVGNTIYLRNIASAVTGTFLSSSTGVLTSSILTLTGTVASGALAISGSGFVATNIIAKDYSGSVPFGSSYPESDLSGATSGSYKYDVQVKNVSNVNRGSLPVKFGGTGLSGSSYYLNSGAILKVSGGLSPTISALSASSDMSGAVLSSMNGEILTMKPGDPYIRYYNIPGTYTWIKPPGVTMVRVICQGAGGGGGCGQSDYGTPGTWYPNASFGGTSGGFSDSIVYLTSSENIIITVGSGGYGGYPVAGSPSIAYRIFSGTPVNGTSIGGMLGGAGGSSSFGNYVSASGGKGGYYDNYASAPAGGQGNTFNGGGSGSIIYNMPSGGGKGGGVTSPLAGQIVLSGITDPKRNFGYTFDSTGKIIDIEIGSGSVGAAWAGTSSVFPTAPVYYGAGGGGGSTNGSNGVSGGGPGAGGYVLVVAW